MWLLLAFLSAALLGFYDISKKSALNNNDVLPVLFLNTLLCSMIFMPFIVLSSCTHILDGTQFHVGHYGIALHLRILLKSCIVLSSWIMGYFAMKHLPITIVGPINATRPVFVLVGAMLVFGEHLNMYQWVGVIIAIVSLFLLGKSGKSEGIDFKHNKWIFFLLGAAITGAISGLYDKYLMASPQDGGVGLDRMAVQSWYNFYQCIVMGTAIIAVWLPGRRSGTRFRWRWSIVLISVFLSMADFLYFYALSLPGAMIAVVSMVRRGSVVVSFLFGAMIFHEKNLKAKALDVLLVIIGMVFLYIGSR